MPKNTHSATNLVPAASVSLASSSSAAVTPKPLFPLLLLSVKRDLFAHTMDFLSAQEATHISQSSWALNTATETCAFRALWQRHIQKDFRMVTQQPSQQAYYQAARQFQDQDQALAFLLRLDNQALLINIYDYSPIKPVANDFKTSTFIQRAAYLRQWNTDLGLCQLENADHASIRLRCLTELTPEVMQRLTAINQDTPITGLSIENCYLPQLPEDLITFLKACTQLKQLGLYNNQLQSLPETLLQACTQLRDLSLSHNQLKSLPETLLQPCPELKVLRLNNNRLQSLPETLLQPCPKLKLLNLSKNHLMTVTNQDFSHLSELSTLRIDRQTPVAAASNSAISTTVTPNNFSFISDIKIASSSDISDILNIITENDCNELSKYFFSQTPMGAASSSAISPEQKTAEHEDEPHQKMQKLNK